MKVKGIISVVMLALALALSASAQDEQPSSKTHAHVLGHVAKYTYKGAKDVAKVTGKAVAVTAEEIF